LNHSGNTPKPKGFTFSRLYSSGEDFTVVKTHSANQFQWDTDTFHGFLSIFVARVFENDVVAD
jgi:hypothetical protein